MTFISITSFVTSRYIATGDAITTITYNFWIGVSTARQTIFDVCVAIWDVLAPIYICLCHQKINGNPIVDEFYDI